MSGELRWVVELVCVAHWWRPFSFCSVQRYSSEIFDHKAYRRAAKIAAKLYLRLADAPYLTKEQRERVS